ncbi:MAG: Calx-beta domain-containing protein, partial [Chitinophagaceae bacterium]
NAHTGTSLSGTVIKPATSGVVSCIAIDPANENHLLVTYTSYGVMHVFETTSALQASPAWTAVGGNLPDMPVRWAIFDPRNSDWAILATELGVWSTNNLNGASTDWSPTNSGFANVRVDMLDYRASDGTLLAATHGRGVFTATIPASTTPDINFTTSNTAATEQTAATVSCRGYKDYTLTMTIANAPAGDATVNLQIEAGNTATRGVDFEFTTNGNFSSPSSSLVFANGATASKTIGIRIYDDAEVESTESFKLIYTISGTTNAVPGSGPQSHTVTIYDDDQAPVEGGSAAYTVVTNPTYNLGSTPDGTGAGQPFDAKLQYKKTQFLYKASELTAAGMKAGSITSIQFLFAFKNSTRPYKNLQVKLGTTTLNYLVDGMVNVIGTSTYGTIASFSPVLGWNTLPLTTPFTWDGTSNIAVEICYDNGSAASGDRADILTGYSDGGSFSQGNIFWQDNLSCGGSYSTVTYYAYGSKPEIRFGSEVTATPIATVLNTSQSEYLGPYADVYFYSATGEILARIKNLTSHDYGCTQVYLDRAGTSALPFWSNFVPDYVMSKTFKVVPTNNNSAGQYQITLYYTKAEVEGWQQLTGQMFTNINLVKVSGRVADVTPSNPTGSGTIQSVAPTRGNFGVNYTLTYTFTTGFSGFGAGNIVGQALPMQLLNFTAQATDVGTLLEWSTSFEVNTKEYVIQRSEDGSHFSDIGNVSAAGNSSTAHRYTYTDRTAEGTLVYYRLKQVTLDESFYYSKVIRVQKEQKISTPFQLLYNPITKNTLELEFGRIPGDRVQLMVADVSGKTLLTKELTQISGTRQQVVLPPYLLSNGVYILRVQTPGRIYSLRFIKSF